MLGKLIVFSEAFLSNHGVLFAQILGHKECNRVKSYNNVCEANSISRCYYISCSACDADYCESHAFLILFYLSVYLISLKACIAQIYVYV